ncbi:MAG TPA: molybdenum cofactor biosynthesis protein MoaE [Planctomycetota bacterium]
MTEAAAFACRVGAGPVDGEWARAGAAGPDAGCVVLFLGTVRARSRGKQVVRLEYQAYPRMVEAELARIAAELHSRHELARIRVEHAVGPVEVGEASVAVAVSAPHRAAAFAAAGELMDELKVRVPIWKHELYPDGSTWIGLGS